MNDSDLFQHIAITLVVCMLLALGCGIRIGWLLRNTHRRTAQTFFY